MTLGVLSSVDARAEIVQVPVTYDGYWSAAAEGAEFDTFTVAGVNGPEFERVSVVTASSIDRAVLEFDLLGIADGQAITSARLNLAMPTEGSIIGHRAGADPPSAIELYGFAGNGVPDASDVAAENLLARFELVAESRLAPYDPIDVTSFVQSQVNSGDRFVGFVLRGANGGGMHVMKGRSNLSITTVPIPEPSSGLIALAAVGCLVLLRVPRVGMRCMTWCARRISYCAVITALLALFVAAPASAESISAIEGSDIMGEAWPIQRGVPTFSEVYGWEFTTNSKITVTDLGWLDHLQDGLLDDHEIGIWNSQRELLVSATIPLGTESRLDGIFRYVPITPTTLPAGETFVIGGVVPVFNIIVFPGQPVLTQWDTLVGQPVPTETAADIVLQSGRSATSPVENALVYPDESYDLSTFGLEYSIYLGPSFQFVPEPSSLSLAMLSLAAFVHLSFRHRRSSRRSNN